MSLTSETFNKALEDNDLIIIDFWAEWCGPCRQIAPILDELQEEYNLPITKLNIDESPKIAEQYDIRSIPALVVFENGLPVKTIIGARPKHKLLEELKEWI